MKITCLHGVSALLALLRKLSPVLSVRSAFSVQIMKKTLPPVLSVRSAFLSLEERVPTLSAGSVLDSLALLRKLSPVLSVRSASSIVCVGWDGLELLLSWGGSSVGGG